MTLTYVYCLVRAARRPVLRGLPAPTPNCSQPKKGLFDATLTTTNSCSWWTHPSPTRETIRLVDDYVQYAFSDDTCGAIHWGACVVTNDSCAPLKFSSGKEEGWIGRGSMKATYTDDTHVTGTMTYEIGDGCSVVLDFTAEALPL